MYKLNVKFFFVKKKYIKQQYKAGYPIDRKTGAARLQNKTHVNEHRCITKKSAWHNAIFYCFRDLSKEIRNTPLRPNGTPAFIYLKIKENNTNGSKEGRLANNNNNQNKTNIN